MDLQFNCIRDIFNNEMDDNLDLRYLLNSVLFYCLTFAPNDSLHTEKLSSEVSFMVSHWQSMDTLVEAA